MNTLINALLIISCIMSSIAANTKTKASAKAIAKITKEISKFNGYESLTFSKAGVAKNGKAFYIVPKLLVDTRYLTENHDLLMNRLIMDGNAFVMEGDPLLSSDDSYCGCNCRCCFKSQSFGKSQRQCSRDCGCDCACC